MCFSRPSLDAQLHFDFAVTAPQRLDALGGSGNTSAAEAYGAYKRRHLDTADACAAQHVTFLPMVIETTGAWAPEGGPSLGSHQPRCWRRRRRAHLVAGNLRAGA